MRSAAGHLLPSWVHGRAPQKHKASMHPHQRVSKAKTLLQSTDTRRRPKTWARTISRGRSIVAITCT